MNVVEQYLLYSPTKALKETIFIFVLFSI